MTYLLELSWTDPYPGLRAFTFHFDRQCPQLTSASALLYRLGSKGGGELRAPSRASMLLRKASGLASGDMNLTKAVLFSSSVNLKSLTYEYICVKQERLASKCLLWTYLQAFEYR